MKNIFHPFFYLLLCLDCSVFSAELNRQTLIDKVPNATGFMAAGDLNGDQLPDLAVVSINRKSADNRAILIYHQQQGGIFPTEPSGKIGIKDCTGGLLLGDFDADGKNDLAIGYRPVLSLFLGSENFTKEHANRYGNDSGAHALGWGRLNKQPKADFLSGAAWRKWLGQDQFQASFFLSKNYNDNWLPCLVDLNWDGLEDIVFSNYRHHEDRALRGGAELRIYYGPFTGGTLLDPHWHRDLVTLTSPLCHGRQILAGDLNGDDQPDLVYCVHQNGDKTLFYPQNSPIGFTENAGPKTVLAGAGAPAVLADLNADQREDLALCNPEKKTVYVFLQKPDWNLPNNIKSAEQTLSFPARPLQLVAGDLNNDGPKELLVLLDNGRVEAISLLPSQ